jgi:L-aspartate oxidase
MRTESADVVVVGAGVAGLRAVLALEPLRVVLVTKTPLGVGGSSPYAQGGIAAAIDRDDSPRLHAADTLAVGGGLNDPAIVRVLTERAPAEIERLVDAGTRFDRSPDGALALGREAGHQRRRIVHAGGDATGSEMVRSLSEAVASQAGVEIRERSFAEELVVEGGRVTGVIVDSGSARPRVRIHAPAVVVATGGAGRLYRYTTNPVEATGDGIAMAARAGALLVDLEFVQFHPTALAAGGDPLPLLTEALRGEGATVIDETGERFLLGVHRDAELAPRDVVARAIFEHQRAGHRVFLDARAALGERIAQRFPTVYQSCRDAGIDPARQPIPITPAAHYCMGGVMVDAHGRTTLPGLWACGEVSATGAHGANRLASNSLLEAVVFGSEAARDARATLGARTIVPVSARAASTARRVEGAWSDASPAEPRQRLRATMWDRVGLVRDAAGLEQALDQLDRLDRALGGRPGELRNLIDVGRLVATAALARRETRGSHVRSDYPASDEALCRRMPIRMASAAAEAAPIAAQRAAAARR